MSSSSSQRIDLSGSALGMVSTISFPAIVGTADMMLKSATVRLVGYEKVGNGFCTAIIRGSITDVRMAVEAGAETAREFGQLVSTIVIPRPYPNLEAILPISSRLSQLTDGQYSRLSNQAIGLLETRGFPAMVGAADMMLKSADVNLAGYETIGAGLCTAIIRGNVADVAIAIEAGMYEAERIGEFHTLMIIPRPLEYWIETPIPVSIPMVALQEQERELVQLPNLEIAEVETISISDR
jgi:carbon dioxide concentrating mechanism protein CcmO